MLNWVRKGWSYHLNIEARFEETKCEQFFTQCYKILLRNMVKSALQRCKGNLSPSSWLIVGLFGEIKDELPFNLRVSILPSGSYWSLWAFSLKFLRRLDLKVRFSKSYYTFKSKLVYGCNTHFTEKWLILYVLYFRVSNFKVKLLI